MDLPTLAELLTGLRAHWPALVAFFGSTLALYLLKGIVIRRLRTLSERTNNHIDDVAINLAASVGLPFIGVMSLFVATWIDDSIRVAETPWILVLVILAVTFQVGRFVGVLFDAAKQRSEGGQVISGFKTILILLVWVAGFLFMLSTLGFDITSLVAGLGIGGIAVALALQAVLGDMFSALSIYFDKPFELGDYIVAGDKEGNVEKVGLKTTRLRSLRGEVIVIPNQELTSGQLQNFGRLKRRRVVADLGFEYDTKNKALEALKSDLPEVFKTIDGVTFDRMHFKSFGDFALIHELVYFVESDDYVAYMDAQHAVNLAIKQYCESKKLGMAYPTQVVINKKG